MNEWIDKNIKKYLYKGKLYNWIISKVYFLIVKLKLNIKISTTMMKIRVMFDRLTRNLSVSLNDNSDSKTDYLE